MSITKTIVAGVEFDSFICNASGPLDTTLAELEAVGASASSAIMMKSCTIEAREGNEEPRYAALELGSIQSMGLPNLGYREYLKFIPKLKKNNKPVIASVAGFSVDDYVTMVQAFQESEVDLIEVNLSCPNIAGKSQVAYDIIQTEKVLAAIAGLGKKPVGLKLPPFYDLSQQEQMAELILKYKISFITCINSIGNTLVIDVETERPVIKPKGGFGGLGGAYIKPVALANLRAFYLLLKGKVSIFGVGGVSSGVDAFEFLLAGADAVQVATVFEQEGAGCFGRVDEELGEIVGRKGCMTVEEVRGRLG